MVKDSEQWAEKAVRQVESATHLSTKSETNAPEENGERKAPAVDAVAQARKTMLPPTEEAYWTTLKNKGKIPNFWMTPEYAEFADWEFRVRRHLCGWVDPKFDLEENCHHLWTVPALEYNTGFFSQRQVWAGFPNSDTMGMFLDHQYLYDAHAFCDLAGGRWSKFRKNVRKYPARNPGTLEYRPLVEGEADTDIHRMLIEWSKSKTIHDPGTMVTFLFFGSLRWGLFRDGNLVGVNVADENWIHGIYRYCLDDGTPFLNEFMRYLFFTSDWAQEKEWINDGGDLDSMELRAFKLSLNPHTIQNIKSH